MRYDDDFIKIKIKMVAGFVIYNVIYKILNVDIKPKLFFVTPSVSRKLPNLTFQPSEYL